MKHHRSLFLVSAFSLVTSSGFAAVPVTSGLALHLEADVGLTLDGSNRVQSWTDQAALNGDNSAAQVVAGERPTLVTGVFANPLLPALRFNGAGDNLDLLGSVLTSQQFTVFAVASDLGGGGTREIFSNWTGDNAFTSVFFGITSSSPTTFRFTDEVGGATDGFVGRGVFADPTTPQVLAAVSGATHAAIYQGGAIAYSAGSALSTRNLSGPYVLGVQGEFTAEYWNGDIGAILVYDRELNPTEIADTMAYLGAKYSPIPEPAAFAALAGLGALGLAATQRRRRG